MKDNYNYIEIVNKNLKDYKDKGGKISYPFDASKFALINFGLDVQYDALSFGGDNGKAGLIKIKEKVIIINPDREDFKIGEFVVPKKLYIKESENQTIAHEIGHYAQYEENRKNYGNTLFGEENYKDSYPNILLNGEIFANKYARNLLIPKNELEKFLKENDIKGTIDLLKHDGESIRKYFGVTEFMLEVRLKELKIPFINGYYIPDQLKSSYKKYSEENLLKLMQISIGNGFGLNPDYGDSEQIAYLYNKITGENRDSGSLYMTIWRIANGKYDNYFESVCEKRIEFLNNEKRKFPEIQKKIIFERLKKEGAEKITIFGSFTRNKKGSFNDKSDIDILVKFKDNKSIFEIMKIKEDLQSLILRKVDLVLEENIRNYMVQSIEKSKEVLL